MSTPHSKIPEADDKEWATGLKETFLSGTDLGGGREAFNKPL